MTNKILMAIASIYVLLVAIQSIAFWRKCLCMY
jgi:hypothetical protein